MHQSLGVLHSWVRIQYVMKKECIAVRVFVQLKEICAKSNVWDGGESWF